MKKLAAAERTLTRQAANIDFFYDRAFQTRVRQLHAETISSDPYRSAATSVDVSLADENARLVAENEALRARDQRLRPAMDVRDMCPFCGRKTDLITNSVLRDETGLIYVVRTHTNTECGARWEEHMPASE